MSTSGMSIAEEIGSRWKPYPAYKDSGVEWLGEIPAHWDVTRVGDHVLLINGYPFDSERFSRNEGIPLVRIRDIYSQETEVRYNGSAIEEALVQSGDILIGMDGDFNIARWSGGIALLNQRLCCLRASYPIQEQFLFYLLSFPLKSINDLTYSTTVKHLSSKDVKKIRFGIPPLLEQRAIASFLDWETTHIDTLIAKKERLIELLTEKRSALISHVVTKGLDPTVPMKDSEVEWLGQIPAHWIPKKLKYLFRQTKRQNYADLTVLSVYRDYGVIEKESRDDNHNRTPENLDTYQLVNVGDLVINKMKAWQGSLGMSEYHGITSPDYVVYAPDHDEDSRFLHYLLRAEAMADVYRSISNGIRPSQWRLEPENFEKLIVFLPPLSEQAQICQFIDLEYKRIEYLITLIQKLIGYLSEYRTALISAVVTGKIDVRPEVA